MCDGDWKLIKWYHYGKLERYNIKEDLGERMTLAEHTSEWVEL